MKHIRKINEFINNAEIYSLIDNIEEDCKYSSDTMDAYNHNSYKKIISIGDPALKYLIECLDRPSAIFWIKALESITGRNTKSETFDSIILEWKNWFNNNDRK